jgi:ABC-type multidrug transport system ATPase subunit
LDDISFSLREKETVVLIGSNGSGKSTVINLIVGFQQADQGEVRVSGAMSLRDAREQIRLC